MLKKWCYVNSQQLEGAVNGETGDNVNKIPMISF